MQRAERSGERTQMTFSRARTAPDHARTGGVEIERVVGPLLGDAFGVREARQGEFTGGEQNTNREPYVGEGLSSFTELAHAPYDARNLEQYRARAGVAQSAEKLAIGALRRFTRTLDHGPGGQLRARRRHQARHQIHA